MFCTHFGEHFSQQWLGEEGLAALVHKSSQGKPNDDGDDDPDSAKVGPDIDEDELIAQKTEFERNFILKFRNLFSETLSPDQYLRDPLIRISIKNFPDPVTRRSMVSNHDQYR